VQNKFGDWLSNKKTAASFSLAADFSY
jgi:hypothetical protein